MHVVVRSMFVLIFFSFKWPVLCHLINRRNFSARCICSSHAFGDSTSELENKGKHKNLGLVIPWNKEIAYSDSFQFLILWPISLGVLG